MNDIGLIKPGILVGEKAVLQMPAATSTGGNCVKLICVLRKINTQTADVS